ncbi:hypothetical protein [Dyella acidisoli]|uniref:Uncharacterized protein n=1 Tax=Dyella acidisoli TaxID=1867834 RepID=A0ABQ5XKX9_9GAMM|nr:hypothetical protein [Dyella acidisoli]GLQ92037.1 hypothetical protein GCM10007901_09880 [Dyella acidisoli]
MEQIVECLIAGGPQHGLVRRQLWDPEYPGPPVVATGDGAVCIAAACRPSGPGNNRFLLLHPRATGAQILSMIAILSTQAAIAKFHLAG